MYEELSLDHFMHGLKKRTPGEPEFHQAVYEVAESVIPFILKNPKYQKAGINDITLKLYKGGRHEMLNEVNKNEVEQDVINWLNEKIKA